MPPRPSSTVPARMVVVTDWPGAGAGEGTSRTSATAWRASFMEPSYPALRGDTTAGRACDVSYGHDDRGRDMVGLPRWFGRTAWVVLLAFAATQPGLSQTARKGWDPMEFRKPDDPKLRQTLTQLQYDVTQHDATEPPFRNEYWDNHRPGLYVDVVSGEPLFSSLDKFESGTGGRASRSRSSRRTSTRARTAHSSWRAPRSGRRTPIPTWGTSSTTARPRPACGTA